MHTPLWSRALGASLLAFAIPMALPAQAAVAPNGMIAISALDDAGIERIFTLQPDGTGLTNITADQVGAQSGPVWSPDSTRILYGSSEAEGLAPTADVWVMNADGSGATLVTPDADPDLNPFDLSPSWSPDGTQFVWSTNREGDEDIYIANVDGSNARPLLVDEPTLTNEFGTFFGLERFPAWSPDGTRIAFFETGLTGNYLSLVDVSGEGPLTTVAVPFAEAAAGFRHIQWSPDGSSLLYLLDTVLSSQPLLAVSNVDTGETFFWDLVPEGYADLATPSYSPDGTQITFSAYSFESGESVVVSIPSPTVTPAAAARMAATEVPGLTLLPGTAGALSNDWGALTAPPMCTIIGTDRNDRLVGTTGDDVICGLGGNDTILGRGGNDTIIAGPGNDTVDAGPGDDVVRGDTGNDVLRGAAGNDRLNGGAGRDQVIGGEGSDRMSGEDGVDRLLGADQVRDNDTLEGGADRDLCTADNGDTRTNC